MMMKRCWKCGGRKEIVGMGNIRHQCDECKGVGSVEVVEEPVIQVEERCHEATLENPIEETHEVHEDTAPIEIIPFRRRGRPRRPNKVIDIN